jgi:hypothetical protein
MTCLSLVWPRFSSSSRSGFKPANNYQGYALLRSIPKSGGDADVAAAVAYAKRIKLYPLSEAARA